MTQLLKKVILFFLISFSLFFSLKFILRNKQEKNYNSAFVDKLKILQSNRFKKKIILFGGSSVGWGFSAELIEKKLGIKTINLGHYAGYGLIDFQSFFLKNITKDDIIIFSPEWLFYADPEFYEPAILDNLVRYNYEYGKIIGNDYYLIKSFFSKIKISNSKKEDVSTAYRYNCLNRNGDIISQCSLPPFGPQYYKIDHAPLKINSFSKYFPFLLTNKTIFVFPPTQLRVYNENKSYLDLIEHSLLKQKYIVADSVADNVYPDSVFFDAGYHIKCDMRIRRTEKLIDYLNQYVK